VWHYLRDPTFSRFDTIPECDRQTHTHTHRQTDRHTTTEYTALSIGSRGEKATKNAKIGVVWGVKSSETSPFDRAHMTSYSTLIETMRLSCTVFEL